MHTVKAAADHKGFTLIELMIVVAIIGILAALAIPAYANYVVRSQVGEFFTLSRDDRMRLSEYYQVNGGVPADLTDIGVIAAAARSKFYTADVTVNHAVATGIITVTYTLGNMASPDAAGTILLTGTRVDATAGPSGLVWSCAPGTFPTTYLPKSCR